MAQETVLHPLSYVYNLQLHRVTDMSYLHHSSDFKHEQLEYMNLYLLFENVPVF